jgi:hypothetical protein
LVAGQPCCIAAARPGWKDNIEMMRKTGLSIVITFLLVMAGVARGASENHRESLRGLTGVSVRVERLSENAKQDGLDERSIQSDAEQKLKQAGIAVLTASQAAQDPGSPTLYIFVNAKLLFYPTGVTFDPAGRAYNSPPYVVRATVSLLQNVVSPRDPNLRLREVKTWDAGYLTSLDPALLKQTRTTVGDLVNEFIADWRTVNQKK